MYKASLKSLKTLFFCVCVTFPDFNKQTGVRARTSSTVNRLKIGRQIRRVEFVPGEKSTVRTKSLLTTQPAVKASC